MLTAALMSSTTVTPTPPMRATVAGSEARLLSRFSSRTLTRGSCRARPPSKSMSKALDTVGEWMINDRLLFMVVSSEGERPGPNEQRSYRLCGGRETNSQGVNQGFWGYAYCGESLAPADPFMRVRMPSTFLRVAS